MCLHFAKLGCRIVVWDINAQGLEKIGSFRVPNSFKSLQSHQPPQGLLGHGKYPLLTIIAAHFIVFVEQELNSEKASYVKTYVVDLSKRESIYAVAAKVKEECGKVDIIINNAGIVSGKPFLECTCVQSVLTFLKLIRKKK